jgi:hypothetical protein
MQSGWSGGDAGVRALAWGLVVVVHVALLWWLARPVEWPVPSEPVVLQLHWIERPVPMRPALTPDPPAAARQPRLTGVVPLPDASRGETAMTPEPLEPVSGSKDRPMSAVFLEQGRRWAADAAPVGEFRRNPLAAREDLVGLPKADRFRMRVQVTPERVLQKVGVLFGGAGYTTDPCPRVRRNLANLATGGERELVEEEVRRLRQLCQ